MRITKIEKERKKTDLLEAGMKLFYHNGYNAVGINDIVSEVEIPKGVFYNYFKSKEEFGQQVLEYQTKRASDGPYTKLDEDGPVLEVLQGFFETMRQGYTKNDFQGGCLMGNMGQEMADQSTLIRVQVELSLNRLRGKVQEVLNREEVGPVSRGEFTNEELAALIVNNWEGAILAMKVRKDAEPIEWFIKSLKMLIK